MSKINLMMGDPRQKIIYWNFISQKTIELVSPS